MQIKAEILIKTLGEIIKAHRLKTGKSIHQISAEASIPKPTWSRIENGKYKDIQFVNLWKISEGLEIDIKDLVGELSLKMGKDFSITENE
ncbi:MAG: helix-turn-helix transcriptional regulator [Methanobrevibacter sp.]|nr:helix-turn-helix transcriptional regulator [Methanobrevibacter sp.]